MILRYLVYFLCMSAMVFIEAAEYDVADYKKQLYTKSTIYNMGLDKDLLTVAYHVQPCLGNYLYLGPNEVFFTPPETTRLGGQSTNKNVEYNSEKEFEYIHRLREEGSKLEWGFITKHRGETKVECFFSAAGKGAGSILTVQIDEDSVDVELTEGMINEGCFSVDLSTHDEGYHNFSIALKKLNTTSLKIYNCRLSGEAIDNSYVVRARWRPVAGFTKFKSSKNQNDVQAWIFEVTTDCEYGFFGPIITDFGYFGSVFDPGGESNGVNMSFWSTVNNGPNDPYLESHLLGIGSEKGTFGYYDHEGRGVKVRNWNIFDTNTSRKYVIGMRYTNDGDFKTFYGYFWNEAINEWQLFTIGRQYAKRPLRELITRAFLEVPGPPDRQRSNHKQRYLKFRGWVRDSFGKWTDINRVITPCSMDLTNQKYFVTEDGEYFCSTIGGLQYHYPNNFCRILRKKYVTDLPQYMNADKLKKFDELPFEPKITNASLEDDGTISVSFYKDTALPSKVTLYWGKRDVYTNQVDWENSKEFEISESDREDIFTVLLPETEGARFFRILVQNDEAQMWSFKTYDIQKGG